MLERAVRELRGEQIEDELPTTAVNLGVDVRIPDDYVYDINQRLRTYKRISAAGSDAEIDEIRAEISDRYGPLPPAVENLLGYARVRNRATALGVASIDLDRSRVSLKLDERSKIAPERLLGLLADSGDRASFSPSGVLRVELDPPPADDRTLLVAVEVLLRELESAG
jgi:transcription-repair coupling factor (superfamily II helicase)